MLWQFIYVIDVICVRFLEFDFSVDLSQSIFGQEFSDCAYSLSYDRLTVWYVSHQLWQSRVLGEKVIASLARDPGLLQDLVLEPRLRDIPWKNLILKTSLINHINVMQILK